MRLLKQQHLGSWFIILSICFIESATDENPNLPGYFPLVNEEQFLANSDDKRFQQIMQGGNGRGGGMPMAISSDLVTWADKPKIEKMDIKKEIDKLNSTYVFQSDWPEINIKLGSVTAVSFDTSGNVVIFHRCDRVWEQDTFDRNNVFRQRFKGPIKESTVLALNREDGKLVYDWGKNLFYMPHGLTVDHEDNVWVTDVALHQVFKFGSRGSNDNPLMTLGTAFLPGSGDTKFCKPTSVAVLKNGDFFIADGYCNARILKYSKDGQKILQWGQNTFSGISYDVAPENFFAVPHALTLVPEQQLVCTADRENGRVQCFFWSNGTYHSQYHSQIVGDRLFSMDYTPARGGQFVIVNGPTAEIGFKPDPYNEVRGYIMDFKSKKVVAKFGPNDMQFKNPHDVAVTTDGNEIYVAELNPTRIYKFLHKSMAKSVPISAAKPTANTDAAGILAANGKQHSAESLIISKTSNSSIIEGDPAAIMDSDQSAGKTNHHRPGATAILVASLMLLFAFFTFGLALLIARRRKRGCMPFGANNRRHAWDFPTKADGFKFGGLLERGKRSGFEKLDQNASDEENDEPTGTTTTTNSTLTNAQFA